MLLTTKQKEVLDHVEGHLVVLAGPGSGKTQTLIEKIFHIFDQQIIPEPYGLLAVTFSNSAVTEIKKRLWGNGFRLWDRVSVQTFHSFASHLLRCYGCDVGIREDFEIIDKDDQAHILANLLERYSWPVRQSELKNCIDGFKRQGIYPENEEEFKLPREKRFQVAYLEYQNLLSAQNKLDFGDVIYYAVKLLRESKLANTLFTNYYRYIIVDEFQDTDHQQLKLIELFARSAIGSTIVADDDQAIYGFRAGDRGNVKVIKQQLQADLITLPENFRSPANIIEAAQCLIIKEPNRIEKTFVATSRENGTLYRSEFRDDHAEAAAVARMVEDLRNRRSIEDLGQIAIISRIRGRAKKVEQALEELDIPCFDRSMLSFDDTWEANVALAIMELCCKLNSSDSLNSLMTAIANSGISYLLNEKDVIDISCSIRAKLRDSSFAEVHPDNAWGILEKSGYPGMLQEVSANLCEFDRLIKNVGNVASCVQKVAQNRTYNLQSTINMIAGRNAIQLTTSHGSKGKEYDYVFFVGVEDDVIPQSWRNPSHAEISEERRIFYVTITRTRKELYITSAKKVRNHPNKKPSRFLIEIPQKCFTDLTNSWQNPF